MFFAETDPLGSSTLRFEPGRDRESALLGKSLVATHICRRRSAFQFAFCQRRLGPLRSTIPETRVGGGFIGK
jgi:hypothetical protein